MKGLDNLIQEVRLGDTGYTESQYNSFDAPVPGESLTNTPGNAAWEHPPTYAKAEDALEFVNRFFTRNMTKIGLLRLKQSDNLLSGFSQAYVLK